ncbi:MAG: hypothetical protein HN870_02085 [Gammaproteobacteria bacterium]|nr:hypothetical protein [Gammaproteobacteria bacterium]MBT4608340.1 hypothetical protein [Thiotrichales bacterium]MBT3968560.1 hypothetical protein [Gammaproteobacteria bacterium]MBT4080566.1 hypothetical protein [Gammaproteobacteria bacterium]MBT5634824.1 hypothetical protein [Gammaproteobacteria bacterium]
MNKTNTIALLAGALLSSSAVAQPLNDFAMVRSGITTPYQQNAGVSVSGELNEISRFLVDQLTQNRDINNLSENPIAVTSMVEMENFKSTNKIGLWVGENVMHELQIRGFKTIDFKMMPAIEVTSEGDFVMSKKVDELRGKFDINYVLTGTFTEYPDGVTFNARIVNMETAVVASTAQAHISKAYYLRLMKGLNNTSRPTRQHQVELRGPK